MDNRRRSPAQFKKKSSAVKAFLLGIALLLVCVWGVKYVISLDYASHVDENFEQKETLPEDGYTAVTPEPVTVTEEPTQKRVFLQSTPSPTKIPYEKYSSKAQRITMPDALFDTVQAEITRLEPSEADGNKILQIEGWGFLEGYDAQSSTIYVAISQYYGSDYRFYNVALRTDLSAENGTGKEKNLQYSGFDAIINIDTLADGVYNLGVYIVNQYTKKDTAEGYLSLARTTAFTVKDGAVTHVGLTD